jgi:hypothetical protein
MSYFFEKNSSEVESAYYREDWIRPTPLLKAIANSLTKYNNLKIELSGYIDPYYEKDNPQLAQERMRQVYLILVDSLAVTSDQVIINKINKEITVPRIHLSPDQLIVEENPRVEIRSIKDTDDEKSKIFSPILANENPQIDNGIGFCSTVQANLDIVSWQLHIKDRNDRTTLFRAPFRIDPGSFIMQGRTVWVGTNEELKLVELNKAYTYSMKIQDQLGRDFYTAPKKFHIQSEYAQDQNVYVFLNKFASAVEYYHFDLQRLERLTMMLINSPAMRVKFNGYACEIGSFDYNLDLAYLRADKLRSLFLDLLRKAYEQITDPSESWEELISRVDENLTKAELAKKFEGYPGNFAEPLKYCRLCSLKEYVFPMNDAYGRNLSRRVDIVFYREMGLELFAKERKK